MYIPFMLFVSKYYNKYYNKYWMINAVMQKIWWQNK